VRVPRPSRRQDPRERVPALKERAGGRLRVAPWRERLSRLLFQPRGFSPGRRRARAPPLAPPRPAGTSPRAERAGGWQAARGSVARAVVPPALSAPRLQHGKAPCACPAPRAAKTRGNESPR
jgi:hypothetical protein